MSDALSDPAMTPHMVEPPPAPVADPNAMSLAERLRTQAKPTDEIKPAPRRRGRPPGSKNKSTLEREAREAEARASGRPVLKPPSGGSPRGDKPEQPTETVDQRRRRMAARADYLATKVGDTINDNLMLLLMSMGMPAEMIYKPGYIPKGATSDKYTDAAMMLTLGPQQTNILGHFLAAVENTDTGGKISGAVTDGNGPLIIYGILSAAVMVQWGKNLMDAYRKFEPLLTQYNAMKREAEASAQAYEESKPVGG